MNTTQTTQTTLIDDPDNGATNDESEETENADTHTTATATAHATDALAPPEKRGGQDCCPWCLAASETFDHHEDGRVGCGYCDAAIPIGTKWYERGEKIVV